MQVAKLSAVQANIINSARSNSSNEERKQIKREIYAVAKDRFGIPSSTRVKCNTAGAGQKGHLILTAGGKAGKLAKQAFMLGDDGKWNGQMVDWATLFPPPAPAVNETATDVAPASVFDQGAAPARWFRLDPEVVAQVLTNDGEAEDMGSGAVDTVGDGGDLPTPHLMLAGRTDLAITADGSIYRKA